MFFELVAVIVAGFAGAGAALLARKLAPSLPRWAVPVAAGLAMLCTAIANEYSWYPRTAGGLPDGFEVASTVENRAPFRPWAMVYPYVDRFMAVDTPSIRTNDTLPGQRLVDLWFFARWQAPQRMTAVIDCEGRRRAAVTALDDSGAPVDPDWIAAEPGDPILATVCREDRP